MSFAHVPTQDSLGKLLANDDQIDLVDCCFTDPLGVWHHCHFAASDCTPKALARGLPFDGSSIPLFNGIHESDLVMVSDGSIAWCDPFQSNVAHLTCNVAVPQEQPYTNDSRTIAQRAERYLNTTGIADTVVIGPEPEFFLFDDVRYVNNEHEVGYSVNARGAPWNAGKTLQDGNKAHRPALKHAYFPVAPMDKSVGVRTEMWRTLRSLGVPMDKHHHEVATCQAELGFEAMTLTNCADAVQTYKYVVRNVAQRANKSATFLPKPLLGDNGSGMHVHQSLWKDGKPLFHSIDHESGLSQLARWYVGGLLKHAPALCAFTNPTTNSYKRLVPGFEAPTVLAYGKSNRSTAVRIPMYDPYNANAKRIEYRVPDATANPYIAFSALLMAGLDGIRNHYEPGPLIGTNAYKLKEEGILLKETPGSLKESLEALYKDHAFLLEDDVFDKDFIDSYINYKQKEVVRLASVPHPAEFEMYYHL